MAAIFRWPEEKRVKVLESLESSAVKGSVLFGWKKKKLLYNKSIGDTGAQVPVP